MMGETTEHPYVSGGATGWCVKQITPGKVCGKYEFEHRTPAPAESDVEALRSLMLGIPVVERHTEAVARAILAAGYLPPAEVARRELVAAEKAWESCWSVIADAAWPAKDATRAQVLDWLLMVRPEDEDRCSCGTDATSLNPVEVVVHRRDGRPCYIADRLAEGSADA